MVRTLARGRNDDKSALREGVNHGKQDSTSRSVRTRLTRKSCSLMSLLGVGTSLTWNLICISEKHPISLLDQHAASEGISELLAWDWSMAVPGSSSSLGTPQLSTAGRPAVDLPWSRCLIIYEHVDHLLARVSADLD